MTADPSPTPAEIEAGVAAVPRSWINAGYHRAVVAAVLRAVLPARDARIRAQVADQIRALTFTRPGFTPSHDYWAGYRAAQNAAEATAHATPPEETHHG